MKPFRSHSLSAKVLAAFGVCFLISVGLGIVAAHQLAAVNAGARDLQINWLPSTRALGDLNKAISEVRVLEGGRLLASTTEDLAAAHEALQQTLIQVDQEMVAYEELPRTEEENALYQRFLTPWTAYRVSLTPIPQPALHGSPELAEYHEANKRLFSEASRGLSELIAYNVKNGVQAARDSESAYSRGLRLILALLVLQAGLIVLLRSIAARHLIRPIVLLTNFMTKLARGSMQTPPPEIDRADELGRMARSVEVFRRNGLELERHREQLATQTRTLEDALKREREIVSVQRNFVAMASHEFRTPLTIIDGQAHRIARRREVVTPEELEQRVDKIRRAAARLGRAINGFIRMARTPEGQIPFSAEDCSLAELIKEAIESYDPSESARVRCQLHLLPRTVSADTALLRQVLENLLENAFKYSHSGELVEVEGWVEDSEAIIAIRDRGIGVPPLEKERVFERYFRGSNVGTTAGTGVGLHTVRLLVEMHGGSVEFEPREGGGSMFIVRLPIHDARPKAD